MRETQEEKEKEEYKKGGKDVNPFSIFKTGRRPKHLVVNEV